MKARYIAAYRTFRQAVRGFEAEYAPFAGCTAYDSAWRDVYRQYGYVLALRVMIAYCDQHGIQVDPHCRQRASVTAWR